MSGSKHDKTEAPTPKEKRDARKKGQVARSNDLVMWAQMFLVTAMLPGTVSKAGGVLADLTDKMGHLIAAPNADQAVGLLGSGMTSTLLALAPFTGALLAAGLIGHFGQSGLLVTSDGLKPKFERMNPMKGFKKMFSAQSGWELAKGVLRTGILAAVAIGPVRKVTDDLMLLGYPDLHTILEIIGEAGVSVVRNTALAGLVLAIVDYGLQKRRISSMLKMTKQEVKDEARQSEGDPHVKQQIRSRQMEISRNRMMADVATATAVIVNPTHYAVAIRYEPGGRAPVVVAKGRGAIALRIREEAERHKVPILRDVPLCRALHAACDLGQEIPLDLYEAVAKVLAIVMSLKQRVLA